jgi:hypothetical protein
MIFKISITNNAYKMNNIITGCSLQFSNQEHCQLTKTCKGWGCRFLGTPIDRIPTTDKEKAKLFSKVYREAKEKGVLECPHYRSLFIDEVLENIEHNKL